MYLENSDTIFAPATIPGTGAISIIRISGPEAIQVADRLISCCNGKLSDFPGYSVHFGKIFDMKGALLDEVLATVFRAPHSYTGEDSVEISCHASKYIVDRILFLLKENGARAARPGEFTQRAFLNGKMDLAQAEAVADLIASQNAAAHKVALNQLKGGFSKELKSMRDSLLKLVSLMELELDFSEEEVEFADRKELNGLIDGILSRTKRLMDSFRMGNAIKNGIPVAIAGSTNTGKSTLLNTLLGEERAIVSDIHGTTRDTIEETLNIDGILFRFIDTAGIRKTDETVEQIGIGRTFMKMSEAQVILAVADLTREIGSIEESLSEIIGKTDFMTQRLIVVLNKADIAEVPAEDVKNIATRLIEAKMSEIQIEHTGRSLERQEDIQGFTVEISAKKKTGIDELKTLLAKLCSEYTADSDITMVTNLRHYEALADSFGALSRARDGLATSLPCDLIAQDIREAIYHLGSIVGEISTDEVLGNIFMNFCIGK